jgi:serine/threonine protein kinase
VSKNGKEVAVKKLKNSDPELNDKQFKNEFNSLKMLRHKNIVQIIGYCYETKQEPAEYNGKTILADKTDRAFCLEYMPNGSLEKYISGIFLLHLKYVIRYGEKNCWDLINHPI